MIGRLALAVAMLFALVGGACGIASLAAGSGDSVVSFRTEKVSGSHVVSTVVVTVDLGDTTTLCVISEDRAGGGASSNDKVLTLAQSCDFPAQRS